MKKINLVIEDGQKNLPDFVNLQLKEIDTIFPCSVSLMVCGNINLLPNENASIILDSLVDKIAPGGHMLFDLTNYKQLCYLYANGHIEENMFFTKIKKINNPINITYIEDYSKRTQKVKIVEVKKEEDIAHVTLTKINI